MTSAVTTLKLPTATRDRLRESAAGRFHSMGDYVSYLVDLDDRQRRFTRLAQEVAATSPEDWDSWTSETTAWEQTELSDQQD